MNWWIEAKIGVGKCWRKYQFNAKEMYPFKLHERTEARILFHPLHLESYCRLHFNAVSTRFSPPNKSVIGHNVDNSLILFDTQKHCEPEALQLIRHLFTQGRKVSKSSGSKSSGKQRLRKNILSTRRQSVHILLLKAKGMYACLTRQQD